MLIIGGAGGVGSIGIQLARLDRHPAHRDHRVGSFLRPHEDRPRRQGRGKDDAHHRRRKPKRLDFAQAAAIPLTAITAWEAFFDRMKIDRGGKDAGKTMLIIGGAGGVGSIGIQLARLAGLKVIATASRPESIAWVKELGADEVVDHRKDLASQVKKPVEYIANFNDLDTHWAAMGQLVAPQGALVAIVGNQKPLPMDLVRSKSATLCWELMFTRPRFKTPDMIEQHRLLNQVADWLDAGKLRGTLKETLSPINAANLRKAHEKLESGTMIGKLVLRGWT